MITKHNIPEYGVTEFNKLVRDILESNYSYVKIRGEISEIKFATKGQLYITIKDQDSILSSVVWQSKINALSVSSTPIWTPSGAITRNSFESISSFTFNSCIHSPKQKNSRKSCYRILHTYGGTDVLSIYNITHTIRYSLYLM